MFWTMTSAKAGGITESRRQRTNVLGSWAGKPDQLKGSNRGPGCLESHTGPVLDDLQRGRNRLLSGPEAAERPPASAFDHRILAAHSQSVKVLTEVVDRLLPLGRDGGSDEDQGPYGDTGACPKSGGHSGNDISAGRVRDEHDVVQTRILDVVADRALPSPHG